MFKYTWFTRNSETGDINSYTVHNMESKVCGFCGQYFRPNDSFSIVIIPFEYRGRHKKLAHNLIVHTDELKSMIADCSCDEDFANKLVNLKVPRRKPMTEEELFKIKCFRTACIEIGFLEDFEKPYGLKMKKRGTSFYLEYHVYTDYICFDFRGKRGLFDKLYEMEFIAKVRNRMNELMGIDARDNFSAEQEIKGIYDSVEKSMKHLL